MKKDYYEDSYENIEFDNYNDLELFLEEQFLPHAILTKQKKNSSGIIDYYPYVRITELSKLKLSENELQHALRYLYNMGIRVINEDKDIVTDFEEFSVLENYQQSLLPERFLTNEEQEEKFALLRATNDPIIREQLIVNNLRIVPFFIWRYFSDINFNKKDLEQYGYEGLITAVDHYVPKEGKNFYGYAQKAIYNYVIAGLRSLGDYKKYLEKVGADIRRAELELNVNIRENPECIKYVGEPGRIRMQLERMLKRKVTDKEVAEAMSKPVDYIQEYTKRINYIIRESLDEKEKISDEELYYDNIEKENLDRALLKEKLLGLLDTLTEKEAIVLKMRYGLNENEEIYTLDQVAEELDITRERARQIEAKALRKLRHPSRAKQVIDYYIDDFNR